MSDINIAMLKGLAFGVFCLVLPANIIVIYSLKSGWTTINE